MDGLSVVFWDVGGGVSIRSIWSNYYRPLLLIKFWGGLGALRRFDESVIVSQICRFFILQNLLELVKFNSQDLRGEADGVLFVVDSADSKKCAVAAYLGCSTFIIFHVEYFILPPLGGAVIVVSSSISQHFLFFHLALEKYPG